MKLDEKTSIYPPEGQIQPNYTKHLIMCKVKIQLNHTRKIKTFDIIVSYMHFSVTLISYSEKKVCNILKVIKYQSIVLNRRESVDTLEIGILFKMKI